MCFSHPHKFIRQRVPVKPSRLMAITLLITKANATLRNTAGWTGVEQESKGPLSGIARLEENPAMLA
jgi:hypothetical protein